MPGVIFDLDEIDFDKPGKHTYDVAFHRDGDWGYVLVPVTVINGRAGKGKAIACFGGTHGNEYEGQIAVRRVAQELKAENMKGRVILVPRLNPPACENGMRESPLDGGNMNRAFPGDPRGSITFRIAHFVTKWIFPRVETIIDLHSAGDGMEIALCTSVHQVKDPVQMDEMRSVAELFRTPFILLYTSEMAGGLLTEEAERQGKIAVGGEFGHSSGVSVNGVRHAYQGLLNVFKHFGNIPGSLARIQEKPAKHSRLVQALELSEYVPAPVSGIYEPVVAVGSRVEKDQLVGRIHDFERWEEPSLEVFAPHAGYLIMQPFRAPTRRGSTMLVIATEVEQ